MPDNFDHWADQHDADNAHLTPAAITACTVCDGDGYRPNGTICDHVDRAAITARGMAKVRQALAKPSNP